jgi:hypothetical protein
MEFWILWGIMGYVGAAWLFYKGYGGEIIGCAALAGGIPLLFPVVLGGLLLGAAAILPNRKAAEIKELIMSKTENSAGGDLLQLTGSFQNVNIKSNLFDVTQAINTSPSIDQHTKEVLLSLVTQLNNELQKAPPEQSSDAEAVSEAAKQVMEQATKEKPNKKTCRNKCGRIEESCREYCFNRFNSSANSY